MGGTTQEGTRKTVQKTTQEDVGTARGRRERLREQTDRKIMKATLGIVISDGIGAVTIEEVARRSGVAKTTIYRRYRNADDLLQRIQPEVAGLPNFNDLKPSRSGLATMLRRIQDCFDSELGLKAVGHRKVMSLTVIPFRHNGNGTLTSTKNGRIMRETKVMSGYTLTRW